LRYPMVDRTGSPEYCVVDFNCGVNPYAAPPFDTGMLRHVTDSEAREIFSEMEKKLGLKVALGTSSTELLVTDAIQRDATEN
jgi:uncharacterized protein (TIGR03435 family)